MALGVKTGGRQKGTPNKMTSMLKDAILQAADDAHGEGLVGYLTVQAVDNPSAFMALLGKVLPLQLTGDEDNPVVLKRIESVIVDPANPDSPRLPAAPEASSI